jgi:hypothetical protein
VVKKVVQPTGSKQQWMGLLALPLQNLPVLWSNVFLLFNEPGMTPTPSQVKTFT